MGFCAHCCCNSPRERRRGLATTPPRLLLFHCRRMVKRNLFSSFQRREGDRRRKPYPGRHPLKPDSPWLELEPHNEALVFAFSLHLGRRRRSSPSPPTPANRRVPANHCCSDAVARLGGIPDHPRTSPRCRSPKEEGPCLLANPCSE